MRSFDEIRFRLRQEIMNAILYAARPAPGSQAEMAPGLPSGPEVAGRLRKTAWAAETETIARRILAGHIPLLGIEIETGPDIRWRRDYVNGIETSPEYFRRVPYLDRERAGDHKVIWELNRHQHLVLLAQTFLLTGDETYLGAIERQIEDWLRQNPFQCGINWASALEVAFRALSWMWVLHLAGGALSPRTREQMVTGLYRHGLHLEYNLSVYFSRNTHLLGEAVALHAIGRLFPQFAAARRWERIGASAVRRELDYQVLPDGAHFEKSSYYQVYALDFFLFHYLLAGRPDDYKPVMRRMTAYLGALLGPAREIPLIGDDDGGRLFHPYGVHTQYGRATVATAALVLGGGEWLWDPEDLYPQAAWWLGADALDARPPVSAGPFASTLFEGAGLAVCGSGRTRALIDAGGFGAGRGGHSHSDTLQILLRDGCTELLVDAGTFTYVGDPAWRDWFRGSAAHNTVRIAEANQAPAAGPFGWTSKPDVRIRSWVPGEASDFLDAECRYGEFLHRRRIFFIKPGLFFILDEAQGNGVHRVEQFWHTGPVCEALGSHCFSLGAATIALDTRFGVHSESGVTNGWRSTALGRRQPSPVLVVTADSAALPVVMGTVIEIGGTAESASLAVEHIGEEYRLIYGRGATRTGLIFTPEGTPRRL